MENPIWRPGCFGSQSFEGLGIRKREDQEDPGGQLLRQQRYESFFKKIVAPATKRVAVAYLRNLMGLQEPQACQMFAVDRTTVRYASKRPQDTELREKLRELANARRRFGYRRLFILLRQDSERSGMNSIYRIYREEALTVR